MKKNNNNWFENAMITCLFRGTFFIHDGFNLCKHEIMFEWDQ